MTGNTTSVLPFSASLFPFSWQPALALERVTVVGQKLGKGWARESGENLYHRV